MLTIKQALQEAALLLKERGIDNPYLDSRVLLEHVTAKSREYITGYPENSLQEEEYSRFTALIRRRAVREPVAHLIGRREFWGLEFKVTKDTLDPRPDSETLIEQVLNYFPDRNNPLRILDFGTGTGCLLLSLLHLFPQASGVGIDISPAALEIAKENSLHLKLENRVRFALQCWDKKADGSGMVNTTYDLIISNPPYIKRADIPLLQPEVSCYEPHLALDGGEDGLDCYRALAPAIASLLSDNGMAILEFGYGQEEQVSAILQEHHIKTVSYGIDLAGVIRSVAAMRV